MAGHKVTGRKSRKGKPTSERRHPAMINDPDALRRISRPVAVFLLGISDRTFRRLEAEGVIAASVSGDGRRPSIYDGVALHAAYLAHVERKAMGSNDTPRDRRDRSQAELNELRLAKERAELLPRDQVVREGQAFVKAAMAKLASLPARLVRVGAIPPSAESAAADVIREAREEMGRWQTMLDLQRAVDDEAADAARRTR